LIHHFFTNSIALLQDCNEEVRKVFQEAEGDTEFTVDGVFINIRNTDGTHYWAIVSTQVFGYCKAIFYREMVTDNFLPVFLIYSILPICAIALFGNWR
jgi:hypothetical protein